MKVCICITIYNALSCVDNLLSTIYNITPPTDIVLVDDASGRDTAERLHTFYLNRSVVAKTVILRNERQQLFTRTVNRGIRYAVRHWGADAVICLNTDCILKSGWYEHLI